MFLKNDLVRVLGPDTFYLVLGVENENLILVGGFDERTHGGNDTFLIREEVFVDGGKGVIRAISAQVFYCKASQLTLIWRQTS